MRPMQTLIPVALSTLLCAACVTAPAGPTPVWLGQTAQGAPIVSADVTSWKEKKFDGLVRQQADFSCGAAVMATLFNHAFGRSTTERQVLVNMLRIADPDIVREKGFSLLDMKNYAVSLGYEAEGYRLDYERLQTLDLPVIALIDIRGYKHFVVVRRAFDDRVAIGDPALGNRFMSRPEFENAWNQVAFVMLGEGYDPETALLDPPEPLSAKRLLSMTASLPGAETAEFGSGPGFDFTL